MTWKSRIEVGERFTLDKMARQSHPLSLGMKKDTGRISHLFVLLLTINSFFSSKVRKSRQCVLGIERLILTFWPFLLVTFEGEKGSVFSFFFLYFNVLLPRSASIPSVLSCLGETQLIDHSNTFSQHSCHSLSLPFFVASLLMLVTPEYPLTSCLWERETRVKYLSWNTGLSRYRKNSAHNNRLELRISVKMRWMIRGWEKSGCKPKIKGREFQHT